MTKAKQYVPHTYAEVLAYADKTQTGINSEKDSVSGYLLQLASSCKEPDQFQAGCESAENERRANISKKAEKEKLSKADRQAMLRLPGCWTDPKSKILRGWLDFGMVPSEFPTFSKFQAKKKDLSKAKKEAQQAHMGGGNTQGPSVAEQQAGSAKLVGAFGNDVTGILFGSLIERIAKLGSEVQEEIAVSLEAIVMRFEAVAPVEGDTFVDNDRDALDALEDEQIAQSIAGQHPEDERETAVN